MALYTELPIYKHGVDLLALAVDVQVQMPRMFKRTLGDRIHEQCMHIVEAMAMANGARGSDRLAWLDKILQHLRATTAMLRVAHDLRRPSPAISNTLWARSVELLDAVGSQAGGWRKQTLETLPTSTEATTDASTSTTVHTVATATVKAGEAPAQANLFSATAPAA